MSQETRFFKTCFGVFQGGGCRGAAFVGALEEAALRGVSFAGVAGTSAGSIVAAMLGAGATVAELKSTVSALDFRQFLVQADPFPQTELDVVPSWILAGLRRTRFRSWAEACLNRGLYSSRQLEVWMNEELKKLLNINDRHARFSDLPMPTWIVGTDLVSRDVKIWSSFTTPDEEVGRAVRCSCSIPGFFQPVSERYVDGGVLSNLPAFVFEHAESTGHTPFATRILAFSLVAESGVNSPSSAWETFTALVDTVVDGGSKVQKRIVPDVHVVPISTGTVRATDFERIDARMIEQLIINGRTAASSFFDDELVHVRQAQANPGLLVGADEIYAAVVNKLDDTQVREVWILDDRTRWLYALYPALLYWLVSNVDVTVFWGTDASDSHEQFRRRMLRAMGVRVVEQHHVPFSGFLIDAHDEARGLGVIEVKPLVDGGEQKAIRYSAPMDVTVLEALQSVALAAANAAESPNPVRPTLEATTSDELIERFRRHVTPYAHAGVILNVNRLRVASLTSMSRVVKGYRYQQIGYLYRLFLRFGLAPFQLAVARYADGGSTIVTPAVVETSGSQSILVQGNTRAAFCHKNDIRDLDCVVVQNVATPLPSGRRVAVRHMLIGGRTLSTQDRYGTDLDRDYRHIERAAHHPATTLL